MSETTITFHVNSDICTVCGDALDVSEVPEVWFGIPFTHLEVWRWVRVWTCVWCMSEKESEKSRSIYESGVEYGYRLAMDERLKEES